MKKRVKKAIYHLKVAKKQFAHHHALQGEKETRPLFLSFEDR